MLTQEAQRQVQAMQDDQSMSMMIDRLNVSIEALDAFVKIINDVYSNNTRKQLEETIKTLQIKLGVSQHLKQQAAEAEQKESDASKQEEAESIKKENEEKASAIESEVAAQVVKPEDQATASEFEEVAE